MFEFYYLLSSSQTPYEHHSHCPICVVRPPPLPWAYLYYCSFLVVPIIRSHVMPYRNCMTFSANSRQCVKQLFLVTTSTTRTHLWRPNNVKLPPHWMFNNTLYGLSTPPKIASNDATLRSTFRVNQFPSLNCLRVIASIKVGSFVEHYIFQCFSLCLVW